ncbi:MAG: RsmD family RNA methyltransferase, partial [Planctomycetota bacterium]
MPKRTSPPPVVPSRADRSDRVSHELRIIGGRYRGSRLQYGAHANDKGLVTRPMKHRVREAIFNLVGADMPGKLAIDLFAGTGAIGLEAISRGAERCLFIEKHVPSAGVVTQNIAA